MSQTHVEEAAQRVESAEPVQGDDDTRSTPSKIGPSSPPAGAGDVKPTPKHVRERQLSRSAALGQVVEKLHRPQFDEYWLRGLAESLEAVSTIRPTLSDIEAAEPIEDDADDEADPAHVGVPVVPGMRVSACKDDDLYENGIVLSVCSAGIFVRQDKGGGIFGTPHGHYDIIPEIPADAVLEVGDEGDDGQPSTGPADDRPSDEDADDADAEADDPETPLHLRALLKRAFAGVDKTRAADRYAVALIAETLFQAADGIVSNDPEQRLRPHVLQVAAVALKSWLAWSPADCDRMIEEAAEEVAA